MKEMPRLSMKEVKENFVKNGYDISTEVKNWKCFSVRSNKIYGKR